MKEEIKNNIGFDLQRELNERSAQDWILGAEKISGLSDEVAGIVGALHAWPDPINGIYPRTMNTINHAIDFLNPISRDYIPIGSIQRGKQDWMNCASNAPDNELEKQHNYAIKNGHFSDKLIAWFKEKKFINPLTGLFEVADAWTSIGSGTTKNGNSLKSPVEFIRKNGLVPKFYLEDSKNMNFSQYHDSHRITQSIKDMAKAYAEKVSINYEIVYMERFGELLGNLKWEIMDSYVDPVDNDYIKRLAEDYNFLFYGYKLTINEIGAEDAKKKMLIEKERLEKLYKLIFHRPLDAGASSHLNYEEDTVLNSFEKGDEWEKIDKIILWAKSNTFWQIFLPNDLRGIINDLKKLSK